MTDLHGISEHAGKSEWNLLWELLSSHGHLKAVTEINVEDVAREPVQHEIWRVSRERENHYDLTLKSTSGEMYIVAKSYIKACYIAL